MSQLTDSIRCVYKGKQESVEVVYNDRDLVFDIHNKTEEIPQGEIIITIHIFDSRLNDIEQLNNGPDEYKEIITKLQSELQKIIPHSSNLGLEFTKEGTVFNSDKNIYSNESFIPTEKYRNQ